MLRWAVIALVGVSGCYSPSIGTCSLACADNNVCPNGFECSIGRCALEGTTCLTGDGGGDDGMVADIDTSGCGDGTRTPGEICYKPAVRLDTMTSGIFDAQLAQADNDGTVDLMFLANNGLVFRYNTAGAFTANMSGPQVPGSGRFLAVNLDGNSMPEIILNSGSVGQMAILRYNGTVWSTGANANSEVAATFGIDVGRIASTAGSPSIVMLFPTSVRAYLLPASGALMPLASSNAPPLVGGRDVAVADFDDNNVAEIAVADDNGIEIFRGANNTLAAGTSPSIGKAVDAIAACNVDGDSHPDIVYSIGAKGGQPGTIGVARWNSGTSMFELPTPTLTPLQFAAIDCVDLDDDMHADVIGAVADGNQNYALLLLRGKSDGTFESPIHIPIPSPVTHIHAKTDYNNDQIPDIVITSGTMGLITILESNL